MRKPLFVSSLANFRVNAAWCLFLPLANFSCAAEEAAARRGYNAGDQPAEG